MLAMRPDPLSSLNLGTWEWKGREKVKTSKYNVSALSHHLKTIFLNHNEKGQADIIADQLLSL